MNLKRRSSAQYIISAIVKDNPEVSKESRFMDQEWKMESLVNLKGISKSDCNWKFEGLPRKFLLGLSEYAYARLYDPQIKDQVATWLTVLGNLYILKAFAKYLVANGYSCFSQLDTEICQSYYDEIVKKGISKDRIHAIFTVLKRYWQYRLALTYPIKASVPEKFFSDILHTSKKANENKTAVIPQEIYTSLLTISLRYLNDHSTMILRVWDSAQDYVKGLNIKNASRKVIRLNYSNFIKDILKHEKIHDDRNQYCTCVLEFYAEMHALKTACALVILAFTGIRASELLSLEKGCCIEESNPNMASRYYIEGKIYKNKGGGAIDRWIANEDVYKAVTILELLTTYIRKDSGSKKLFITDGRSFTFCPFRKFEKGNIRILSFEAIVYSLNSFVKFCKNNLKANPIPEWRDQDGNLQNFNTRQFRRTLAPFIAQQPFGVIAGMMHYKHDNVTVFEGYANTSKYENKDSGVNQIDILSELAIDLSQNAVTGAFGINLKDHFEQEFKGRIEDFPPSQIAKWLELKHKNLFVGKFNLCFYDPAKALCNKNAVETSKPVLNSCSPTHCSNSCVSRKHLPVWKAQLAQAEEFSDLSKSNKYQNMAMVGEIANLKKVISIIEKN